MTGDVLAPGNRERLARFASASVLAAFDFDGTLAPIVADPGAARPGPRTRELLREVARRFPTAVISGRSRADVLQRLEALEISAVIGNHGIEHEDVFRLDAPGRLLGIRVGADPKSKAKFTLADQAAIDDLLLALLAARPHSAEPAAVSGRRPPAAGP